MIENMMNNKGMPNDVSVIHHKKDTSKSEKRLVELCKDRK
jgi:hypothetical protein